MNTNYIRDISLLCKSFLKMQMSSSPSVIMLATNLHSTSHGIIITRGSSLLFLFLHYMKIFFIYLFLLFLFTEVEAGI